MTLKSAVLAPTPSATVRIAASAKAGRRRRERTADRMSIYYKCRGAQSPFDTLENIRVRWRSPMFIRSLALFLCAGFAFAAAAPTFPALTYSTYLRDNFTPTAIATDSSGNIYLTGNVVVDPPSTQTNVLVLKLNPQATEFLY